jgi:formate--tetrahydrofolate ligase
MAIFCLANDLKQLKEMLGQIIVGYTYDDEPVTAKMIGADGAMTVLLKDALQPNVVQTLENTLAIIHGGPFANIAHGCNSVKATKTAMKIADYVVTEAGFGADLGAEKFFDIKCRKAGIKPDAVVLVATVRAMKYNGGVAKADLSNENLDALAKGFVNLEKHIENIQKYGVPVVVTLNHFVADTEAEVAYVKERCEAMGATFAVARVWAEGGEGGKALAEKVLETLETKESNFKFLYEDELNIVEKVNKVCKDGKSTMQFWIVFLVSLITFGIPMLVWFHRITDRIGNELQRRQINYSISSLTFWGWYFLGSLLFGIGPLVFIHKFFKATNLLNANYNERGE